MKKQLIATLVGAVILFLWQFLSWTVLNVHGAENAYTPNQGQILEFLSENLEEGEYFLPTTAPGASQEEYQNLMQESIGKPWARISYHSEMQMSMGGNLIRGFLVDLIAVALLVWLLSKFARLDLVTALGASLAVGFIGYLTFPYMNSIWFEGATVGYIVDVIAQWGLIGVWLGWYLNR